MARFLDVFIASLLLAITLPLLLMTALAIKWESSGPAFDHIEYVARDGRRFDLLNFRIRHYGVRWARTNQQATKVGEFLYFTRIDCLPQLVNVIRGDLTICGTSFPAFPRT